MSNMSSMSRKSRKQSKKNNGRRGHMDRKNLVVLPPMKEVIVYEDVKESPNMLLDLKLLKKMYVTHSPSGKEDDMILLVKSVLKEHGVPFQTGKQGEVFCIHSGRPLLCAHMDQVQHTGADSTVQKKQFIYGWQGHGQAGLGADDKNGVWIILNLILQYKDKVSFLFSTMEESGGMTDGFMQSLGKEITDGIPYALIFDRRGNGDIIGVNNAYCENDFQEAVVEVGAAFGYKPANGVWSDCDHISNYVPCVNLSCGYYQAHSEAEYTNVNELLNALDFGAKLLAVLGDSWYNRVQKKEEVHGDLITRWGAWTNTRNNNKVSGLWGGWQDRLEEVEQEERDVEYDLRPRMTINETIGEDKFLDDDFVASNYCKFDVIHATDGFYLDIAEHDLIELSDVTTLHDKDILDVQISNSFKITIMFDREYGYDTYISAVDSSMYEEITYVDYR